MSWSPVCDLIQCRFSEGALLSGLAGAALVIKALRGATVSLLSCGMESVLC